jgi:hypothetical protein
MAGSNAVARALVEYDARLAEHVLRLVATELGVDPGGDVRRLQGALSKMSLEDDAAKTTVEWKAGFAHVERLRALGLELARLLNGA